ncbi:hypothetical protein [Cyanobacterium sp. Dongsha4]|uniref:hypothetical protein n=1 Tax=Cyanobacterium sp. DS4 TaxID=2878255 RepID=UPI002E81A394|nr:hypothetical protein [Cyanobacterium sp. Dongsha4]WVK99081.1 hypothetical protein Dongsha4_10240 [Cyanobacterium sp. Dongsha4]
MYYNLAKLNNKICELVHKKNHGINLKFVTELEERFKDVLKQFENVNTIALIDGFFYQEIFSFFWWQVRFEKAEYITKVLPNLLLGFGLLGTFLGITLNLNSINNIINGDFISEDTANITNLITQLQTPLESMGIAFVSSLVALSCSSVLIIINIFWNVNVEKVSLLNNLENYFDNQYKLEAGEETRLDKAVNRMVRQQEEFLTRFHEKVGQVLERTFQQATDQMMEQNERNHQLSLEVYQNFLSSASALHTGANVFKTSIDQLNDNLDNHWNQMGHLSTKFSDSVELLELSATKIKDSAIKIENSKFGNNLDKLTNNLFSLQDNLSKSISAIATNIQEFISQNQRSQNLSDNIYQNLALLVIKLEKSLSVFSDLTEGIKDQNLTSMLQQMNQALHSSQQQFKELNQLLEERIKSLDSNIEKLPQSLAGIDSLNNNLTTLSKLNNIISEEMRKLESYLHSWQSNNQDFLNGFQEKGQKMLDKQISTINESINESDNLKQINGTLALFLKILQDIRQEVKNFNMLEEKNISFRLIEQNIKIKS